MLKLTPHSYPKRVGVLNQAGDTLVTTSDPCKRILFGQKQIICSVLLFCLSFCGASSREQLFIEVGALCFMEENLYF